MKTHSLGTYFEFLLSQPDDGEMRSLVLDSTDTGNGPIVLAIDADECRHLLIPMAPGATVRPDRKSAGIQVGGHQLLQAGVSRRYADLSCRMAHLNDVFELVADEILERVLDDPSAPDRTAGEVLERWRELLGRPRGSGPMLETLIGLWGELWHLREFALQGLADPTCWAGPLKAIHDFESAGASLEVKTTTVRQGWRLKINGTDQLEIPADCSLHLSALKVEQAPGDSVADLFEQLLHLGMDKYELAHRLDQGGVAMSQLDQVRSITFRLVEHRAWRIDAEFPRIIAASFKGDAKPLGVAAIDYVLDLTAWGGPFLDQDEWEALVKRWSQS